VFDEVARELRYLEVAVGVPEIVKTSLNMDEFAMKTE